MATPLDEATKQAVLAEAQNRANRFGISKEQALYNYAVENGIDNASVDTMMGFAQGGTDAWLKQRDNYAQKNNIRNAGIDSYMGFNPGQTAPAPAAPAPAPAPTPAAPWRPTPASPWRPPAPTPAPTSVQPLDEATKQAVLAEAQNRANRFGISKEQALYNYAVENGIDNASVDTMMGFAQGGTDAWLKQRDAGTQASAPAGQQAAQQGNSSANLGIGGGQPTYQPLAQDHRAAVLAEAQNRATASGKSAEQELYDYAHKGGIDNAGIDTLMGFAQGGTDAWLKQRDAGIATQGGGQPTYQPLAKDHRAAVLSEAQRRATASGKSAEQELYDYAHNGGISNAGIDTLMGFAKGGTDAWLKQTSQQGNLGMGGYNPQQNPYLRQMGVDVGNQMFDQWSRNTLPSIRSGAMAAGGFGGSRQGVVEANGINDMNRQYGQALTSMYGNDWSQQQGRNLQQQGLNNSYDLGLRSNDLQNRSVNNSYDLGLRSSDLGFANLDANINQNNFGNQMQAANFGLGVYNTLNNQTQAGIQAGTNIQNTPLDYQKYFSGSANSAGGNGGTGTTSQTNQGNPWLGAVGGAVLGNQFQKNWSI